MASGSGSEDLLDKVTLESYIGFGGTGKVFKGIWRPDGRKVAVKLIKIDDPAKRDARIREARTECASFRAIGELPISTAEKQRIVQPIEVGWTRSTVRVGAIGSSEFERVPAVTPQLVAVYPLVTGLEMFDVVRLGGLPENVTKFLLRRVVRTVGCCHKAGVAHRDLKLDNIMINKSDCDIRLIDFGMAALAADTRGVRRTKCGTLMYNSPDRHGRVAGIPRGEYDAFKGDVWSLGVLAFTMLTGRMPYSPHRPGGGGYRNYSDPAQDCGAYAALSRGDSRAFWAHHERGGLRIESRTSNPARFKQCIDAMLTWDPRRRPDMGRMLQNPWLFNEAAEPDPGIGVIAAEMRRRDGILREERSRAAAARAARSVARGPAMGGARGRARGGTGGTGTTGSGSAPMAMDPSGDASPAASSGSGAATGGAAMGGSAPMASMSTGSTGTARTGSTGTMGGAGSRGPPSGGMGGPRGGGKGPPGGGSGAGMDVYRDIVSGGTVGELAKVKLSELESMQHVRLDGVKAASLRAGQLEQALRRLAGLLKLDMGGTAAETSTEAAGGKPSPNYAVVTVADEDVLKEGDGEEEKAEAESKAKADAKAEAEAPPEPASDGESKSTDAEGAAIASSLQLTASLDGFEGSTETTFDVQLVSVLPRGRPSFDRMPSNEEGLAIVGRLVEEGNRSVMRDALWQLKVQLEPASAKKAAAAAAGPS